VASREAVPRDVLRRRLLLVLFALGTNMGIKRVVATGKHGESEAVLRRIRHLFVNRTNMRSALVKLVNHTFAARDEGWWGAGTACASDSRKFGAWSSNFMTEWHQRYNWSRSGFPGALPGRVAASQQLNRHVQPERQKCMILPVTTGFLERFV
jgi:hypothetical protein